MLMCSITHFRLSISRLVKVVILMGVSWPLTHASGEPQGTGMLTLPPILSDHAILQRSAATRLWGRGRPGEAVEVRLAGTRHHAVVSASGEWLVEADLSAADAGPHLLTVESAAERLEVQDVLIGDVWLASGQSNMQMRLRTTAQAENPDVQQAIPGVREFRVALTASREVKEEARGAWRVAEQPAVSRFSAVGYFFGRRLHAELGRPIGLINNSWGNTPLEPWLSDKALHEHPILSGDAEKARAFYDAHGPEKLEARHVPGWIYNGIVAPLEKTTITGFIWYQGESNTKRAALYREAFQTLINDWRANWKQGDLPFYYCQIANYHAPQASPNAPSQWAELRAAQAEARCLPKTEMVVLMDAGEEGDIHPRDKQTPGERLAAVALDRHYGKSRSYAGPRYRSMEVRNGAVRLRFDHVEGGLVARPLPAEYKRKSGDTESIPLPRNSPGSELEGFSICGKDARFHWATAHIEGDEVIVFSPAVQEPVAVRYGWADNPIVNLYNRAGFPAEPFRTDAFPLSTAGKRLELPLPN